MFGLNVGEILFISVIALVLFGNEKLPENIKKFSRAMSKSKSFLFDMHHTWHEMKEDIKKSIELEVEKTKFKELTKPIEIISQTEIDQIKNAHEQKTESKE